MMRAGGRWTWFRAAEISILVAFTVMLIRNALVYPAIAGIDAFEHIRQAWDLVILGRLGTTGSYYTPPGWYAIAGELLRFGDWLDLHDVERPAQLLSALLTVASAVVLLGIVGRVFPQRPWLRLWALAGFCACPAVIKPAAMMHPQPLVLLFTTLALFALVRIVGQVHWSVLAAVGLGVALGCAQLVRSVGLWIYLAALLTFVVALILRRADRKRIAVVAATALALGLVVPLPWYVYLQVEYGDPIFGGRPEITVGMAPPVRTFAAGRNEPVAPAPAALRAPRSFFTATGLPELITRPYRGALEPAFVPVVLADTWGDYFGQWRWGIPDATSDPPDEGRLELQMLAGLPLTFVTLSGLLALGALFVLAPRRRLPYLPLVALPVLAIASLVVYAWRYPSTDGDTVKALFLLPAAPAFAAAFGFAADVGRVGLPRVVRLAAAGILVAALVVCAEFGIA
jgi:4-amino-4-deoxy-L-arabinose transferase-like glycosyltransferase